jgi:3-methylfumaryl-CoA hydratase
LVHFIDTSSEHSMSQHDIDLTLLRQWVGKTESHGDTINPGFAAALAATLDHPQIPVAGDALPPLWHWIYFWTTCRQSEVGDDGHPRRGGFLPPVPLPRRMWAGGRLRFAAPLPIGATATKTSRIASVDVKKGKTGELAFVTVAHEIAHNGKVAVHEEADWRRRIEPDPVLLFRYSALTFNGHRIHYDRSYVTGVEGYPGLIVHGPLIATLLVDLWERKLPRRAGGVLLPRRRSAVRHRAFTVCGKPGRRQARALWAQNLRGELAMQAEACSPDNQHLTFHSISRESSMSLSHNVGRLPGYPRRRARAVRRIPAEYHRKIDEQRGYPEEFVDALTKAGWLAALIPAGVRRLRPRPDRSLGDHGRDQPLRRQLRRLPRPDVQHGHLLRHGSAEQKQLYLPKIASGELRLQSMGVTEPTTGTDTTKIKTTAVKKGDATSSTARRCGSRASSIPT